MHPFLACVFAYNSYANNNDQPPIVFFILGAFLMGFIWLVVVAARWEVEHKHEIFTNGHYYSTKRANRIVGTVGERIADGKWVATIRSLWRTNPDPSGEHRFFILWVDELNPPKIYPLSLDKAKNFINETADAELARKLIRDWCGGDPVTTSHHHH